MSTGPLPTGDWASTVAERILGDIPHTVSEHWAGDVPERMAAALRLALAGVSSDRQLNVAVERIVWALPDYLPEQATARLRAKLIGALLTAAALGPQLRAPGTIVPESVLAAAGVLPGLNNEVDP